MSNDRFQNNEPDDADRLEQALPDGPQADREIGVDANDAGEAASARTGEATADAYGRGEGVGEGQEVQGLSQGQIVWSRFIRHRGAIFGLVTLGLVILLSVLSMGIRPIPGLWRVQEITSGDVIDGGRPTLSVPGIGGATGFAIGANPFGQDSLGRDYFAQVMLGVQTSLLVAFILGIVALLIGVTVGSAAGFYRGKVDMALMRFTDLIITLPVIVLGAVLGALVSRVPLRIGAGPELTASIRENMPVMLAVALGCILWTGLARLVRSEFLTLREREFVDSARVAGASDWRIITKHMLPNAIGVIVVNGTLLMSAAVTLEAALSFVNFGIGPPNISLGYLISDNQGAFSTRPWLFWWPGLFIILIALSINFIGDGLRDAFDPRTKKIPSARAMAKAEKQLVASRGAASAQSNGATAVQSNGATAVQSKEDAS
ncbi:ABC transporter permease [Propioniciclava soli]|uniref:ABC transporter permease n=1 Tax=Propioniciclava soli TaxID=2775081 RepID=A0ABZ3C534_9ACTN